MPTVFENGQKGVSVTLEDITDRKRLMEDLQASEEIYNRVISTANEGVCILDRNLRITFTNERFADMLGYLREEVEGHEVWDYVFEDDKPTLEHHFATRSKGNFEIRGWRKNGSVVWFLISASPLIGKTGSFLGFFGMVTDITERKQAEEALRESEEKYQSIIEGLPDAVSVVDKDLKVTFANANLLSWLQSMGRPTDIIGKTVLDAFPFLSSTVLEEYRTVFLKGKIIITQESSRIGDSEIVTETRKIPVEEKGDIVAVIAVIRNITERKKAEDSLRESERRFALFMENLPAAMYIKDRDGHVVFSNRFLNELFGWSDPIGKSTIDLLPLDVAQRMIEDDHKAFDQDVISVVESVTDIHGKKRYFKTTKFSVPDAGGASLMGGISLDITEQKQTENELRQSEEKYRKLLFGAGIGVGYWNPDGILLYLNEISLKRLNGKEEDFIGKHIRDLIKQPGDAEKYLERMHKAAISPEPLVYEDYVTLPSGKGWYLSIYARITDSDKAVIGIQVWSIDITERKKVELALDVARKKLKVLNTIASQDIQESVFALSAYLSLAKKEFTDKKFHEYIDKETDLTKNIIQSLNVANECQELGTKPPKWQKVEDVFIYAISHLDFSNISRDIVLDGLEVYADPLLEKAFFHMMHNTLAHGVRVTEVRIYYKEIEGGIRIVIEDNGVGVPREKKEYIFERGFGKGRTLGLFIVREMLSITGMMIVETGEPGKGARFEITVPKGSYRFSVHFKDTQ